MSYVNKGFSFQTNKAVYKVEFDGFQVGAEKWIVKIRHIGHGATGGYELPANWGRTRVFQFLNSLDEAST